jgi:uncharacterized lipoprotein YbaY
MKSTILFGISAAAVLTFSACTMVETQPAPVMRSTTTTTESNTLQNPILGTTETRTTRTY